MPNIVLCSNISTTSSVCFIVSLLVNIFHVFIIILLILNARSVKIFRLITTGIKFYIFFYCMIYRCSTKNIYVIAWHTYTCVSTTWLCFLITSIKLNILSWRFLHICLKRCTFRSYRNLMRNIRGIAHIHTDTSHILKHKISIENGDCDLSYVCVRVRHHHPHNILI